MEESGGASSLVAGVVVGPRTVAGRGKIVNIEPQHSMVTTLHSYSTAKIRAVASEIA